jgi:hypothetical protein
VTYSLPHSLLEYIYRISIFCTLKLSNFLSKSFQFKPPVSAELLLSFFCISEKIEIPHDESTPHLLMLQRCPNPKKLPTLGIEPRIFPCHVRVGRFLFRCQRKGNNKQGKRTPLSQAGRMCVTRERAFFFFRQNVNYIDEIFPLVPFTVVNLNCCCFNLS